jgi:predicted phosphate transport protein (TIGR00153 family)
VAADRQKAAPLQDDNLRSSYSRHLPLPRLSRITSQTGETSIRQVAALPYRTQDDGTLRLLMVTSRDTRRWIIPKGNPIRGLPPHLAAAQEALEEAGVSGIPCPSPLGSYQYWKRRKDGRFKDAQVEVFPLAVLLEDEEWPESHERERRWFSPNEAAAVVEEVELATLITGFKAEPPAAGPATRALLWTRQNVSERVPGLRWFHALMPKQGRFFDLFEAHAATLVAGADALAKLLQGGDQIEAHSREIIAREHEADEVTRQVLQDVRRTFVTPFDRSAITDLIGSMDDAIDQMHQTAKAITLFEVKSFEPQMRDISAIIVEAARITADAMPLLRDVARNGPQLLLLTERLVRIEGHADEIHDSGRKTLFKSAQGNAMDFVVGNEIYSHLEKIVDRFEDVANEIQGLVIDHA